jgi:DNA-binding NarL/FixJ family response regulator
VDDSAVIRAGLRHFFKYQARFEVCGEAMDGLDALEKARDLNPDLIILDLSMPRMNGLEAAPRLRAIRPQTPIILFTIFAESIRPEDSAAVGVRAVLSKDDLVGLQRQIDAIVGDGKNGFK